MKLSSILLLSLGLAGLGGCGLLDKLKKQADAGDPGPVASAAPDPGPSASVAAADTAVPSASAGPDVPFVPPGACVDPVKDAKKRVSDLGAAQVDDIADLDGDGKKDKTVGFLGMGMNWPFEIYVMRGACGHWVGEVNGKGVAVGSFKSKGLKSVSSSVQNPCTADCGCMNQDIAYGFNGKSYVAGKAKDVLVNGACDAGKPAASASATAAKAYVVGDKLTVDWKGTTYPATVIQVAGKDQYKIHYDGYDAKWDEVVGPSRIKGKR